MTANANVLIDKNDLRASTFQIYHTVTRWNRPNDRPAVLTMDWFQKYQICMAENIHADFFHLQPNVGGIETRYNIFYGKDCPNVKIASDILKIPNYIDIAITHDRYTHIKTLKNIGDSIGFPLIHVEHNLPGENFNLNFFKEQLDGIKIVFRNKQTQTAWDYDDTDSVVILDGIVPCDRKRNPTSKKWFVLQDNINLNPNGLWKDIRDDADEFLVLRGDNGYLSTAPTEAEEEALFNRHVGYINFSTAALPFDLLRAAARAMPIISRPTDSLREFFNDGESILFVDTADDLEERVHLKENDLRKIGNQAREVIKKYFKPKEFTQQWKYLIKETMYN